jgi:hypothetical protein
MFSTAMNDNAACSYVGKYMRKAGKPKPIRQHQPSPYHHYLYAFRNLCAMPPMSSVKSYLWHVKLRAREYPSIHVIMLLDEQYSCDAVVHAMRNRFVAINDICIYVTQCERAFRRLCRTAKR